MKYYSTMERDAIELMENLFGAGNRQRSGETHVSAFPRYEARRDENGLEVAFELPGIDPAKTNVQIDADLLKVSGERMEFGKDEAVAFERTLRVPNDLDPGRIEAQLKNGLLRISIPTVKKAEPKQISITVE